MSSLNLTVIRKGHRITGSELILRRGRKYIASLVHTRIVSPRTRAKFRNQSSARRFGDGLIDIDIYDGNKTIGQMTGLLDSKTGEIKWLDNEIGRRTVDEYSLIVDRMLQWYFDRSMPPLERTRATYEVEL